MSAERIAELRAAMVNDRVKFAGERNAYTIQARSERFIVCTKPFPLRRTVIYTIVDLQELVRGPENLTFGAGAETPAHCERMVDRLEGRGRDFPTEVSRRNRVPLVVDRVIYLGAHP